MSQAQGLAVDRDRPPSMLLAWVVMGGEPAANHTGQGLGVKPARVRRMVVSVGTAQWPLSGSRRAPSAARTGWGASAAHSAIAVIDRAPAKTAAAASPRMATSGWRRPARALGSVMVASEASKCGPSASWSEPTSQSGASPEGIGDDGSAGTGFHRGHEAVTTA
jgi:hypothetical protein